MRTDKKPLSCEEARDLMFDYLDNNLTPSRTERLLAHLAACADCRAELDERREMLALIADVAEDPPAALHDSIMRAIADIPQDAPGFGAKILTDKKRRFIPWGTIAAACAAVMILVAGRGMLPGTGAGDIVSPAADRLALAEAADATDTDAALYQAKLGDLSGEEDVVIVETTAGVSVLSPGPAPSDTKNTPVTKQKADAAALDALIDANPDTDAAVLALYASAFDGLAPVTEAEQLTVGGFDVTCYRVTENAAETFGGYVNLFEKEKIDYRVNIPEGSEFDEFQIWLLDEAAK
ncbi:MAG: zf-HC2 domain-containing protein [Clostridia bacterium]|nr:zf-HC2 domain-containing protein [Clostridia bacterium]